MPIPHAIPVVLTDAQRQDRHALLRAHSTPQSLARRARIVLRAADDDHPTNLQIAAEIGCSFDTVTCWRGRFAEAGLPGLLDRPRSGRPPVFPPSERLHVVELATLDPRQAGCPAACWSLDELARQIINEAHHRRMSRATIWRTLDEADLKPHKSHYWLNTHTSDFSQRVSDLCRLYLDAPRLWGEVGELVLCVDEKTGVCVRQRKHPTRQVLPGAARRVEHQYFRRGMTQLTATFAVPTGKVSYSLAQTHNGADFVAHLKRAAAEMPEAKRYHWVLDNSRSHATQAVCEAIAQPRGRRWMGWTCPAARRGGSSCVTRSRSTCSTSRRCTARG